MVGGTLPTRVVWVMVGSCVLAAGTLGFVIGAFVVGSNETVRELLPPPQTGIFPDDVALPYAAPRLPKPDGPPPRDEAQARNEVIRAIEVATAGSSTDAERLASIQDSEGQVELRQEVLVHFPQVPLDSITARVEEVRFLNRTTAAVRYTILIPGYSIPEFPDRIGRVVLDDGTWKATRETACADLALGGVTCPAR
jgi:hypothetical protein